jgi:iron complex outermembrane receptor protein
MAVFIFALSAAPGAATDEITLKDMVVTAQKQDENYKDIPISLSVFDEFDVEDKGFENYSDLSNHSSNFTIFEAGGTGMMSTYIRGVASDTGVESANVGVYVDGIPYVNTYGNDIPIENVQRIEVLKGPQSVFYGKNSYAGVVNIISRPPSGRFEGNVGITLGSDNKRKYDLTLNTPALANGRLNIGIFARHDEKDGFIRNTELGNEDNYEEDNFGRIHLLFTPADRLEFSLISSLLDTDHGAPAWNLTAAPDRTVVANELQGVNQTTSATHSFKGEYTFGGHSLSFIATFKDLDNRTMYDGDFTNLQLYYIDADMEVREYSQEVRMSGAAGPVDYLVGLYADSMRKDRVLEMNGMVFQRYGTEGRTLSVFANGEVALGRRLSLSLGARLDRDEITLNDGLLGADDENDYTHLSPKVSLEYAFTDDAMAYATVSRGYKSGGYYLFAPSPDRRWVDKESMTNYEIGAKSYIADRFSLGASAFFMKIKDKQVTTHMNAMMSYVDNAARCETVGFELDMDYRLSGAVGLYASLGVADSEFKAFSDSQGDYTGNTNPFSPKVTYTVGGTYRDTRGLFATAGLRGQGKSYSDKENANITGAFSIIDAKVGYEAEAFEVYLYADNLLDEVYDTNYGAYTFLSSPREIGARLKYRF